jgi:MoaA/NifB/PqqE/SkfB family radical SAM enzyme
MGEPLLNPDFFKMVKHCKNRGIDVSTFTNGTLITEDVATEIVSSGLKELWISIDGATAETYEDIRPGASFDRVLRGIELIVSARRTKKGNQLRLGLWFIAMERNIHELPLLVELCE